MNMATLILVYQENCYMTKLTPHPLLFSQKVQFYFAAIYSTPEAQNNFDTQKEMWKA